MSDPFNWTIHLGRWGGVQVRLHFLLILFAALSLLEAALADGHPVVPAAAWLLMLLASLLLHEAGHAAAALRLGLEPDDVRLWPLGNLTSPGHVAAGRSVESVIVAASGLIVSGTLALSAAIALNLMADARMVFNPFGNELGGGAPLLADGKTYAAPLSAVWFLGWFGYLNWVIFLANLIPAAPLDMGRVLRGLTDSPWGSGSRDGMISTWTARVCSVVLVIGGLIRIVMGSYGGFALIALGIFLYLLARLESRMMDEGGFFEDTVFGYDFSQGYTSLEAGPATVRPAREGALARWRRRRSELRLQRQAAREAAEEQRMDAILDKIHREGRQMLSLEEQRFLVRVSAKYKNRTRTRN
jgi:Zn-dependent protease